MLPYGAPDLAARSKRRAHALFGKANTELDITTRAEQRRRCFRCLAAARRDSPGTQTDSRLFSLEDSRRTDPQVARPSGSTVTGDRFYRRSVPWPAADRDLTAALSRTQIGRFRQNFVELQIQQPAIALRAVGQLGATTAGFHRAGGAVETSVDRRPLCACVPVTILIRCDHGILMRSPGGTQLLVLGAQTGCCPRWPHGDARRCSTEGPRGPDALRGSFPPHLVTKSSRSAKNLGRSVRGSP